MEDELSSELLEGVQEGAKILAGRRQPSRLHHLPEGAARVLFQVVAEPPEAVLDAVHNPSETISRSTKALNESRNNPDT